MWEPSKDSYIYAIWLRKFTILILKSNQLVIAIAGGVVNVNAIRIISNTLPQFGEIIHTFHGLAYVNITLKKCKITVVLIFMSHDKSVLPMHYYSLQGRQDALRVAVLNIEDVKTCQ